MTELADLPTGTVAFLFTDLEGSTRLLEAHPHAYRDAVARHHALLRAAVEAHRGVVFETVGDAVYAAFAQATDAVAAALAGQVALQWEAWGAVGPLRARMGVHLGEVERQGAHYFGAPLYRCARLTATAHGGQVVLSQATYDLVRDALPAGVAVRDLGEHRLSDLARPERVFQLLGPDLPAEFPALRSLDALPHNLPLQLTSFVGRERELAAVRALLAQHRLVTLTGPGGVGKTRLGLQAAADLLGGYQDGVWLVELAPLADPALVPQAVAAAVGVREEPGRPLLATLTDALTPRRLLLVLDNCEHLIEASARLSEALLRACAGLALLVTSRAVLRVSGEHAVAVPPLARCDPAHLPPVERLSRYEAVRLFAERAQAARTDFVVTDQNARTVAEVCARLDGLPLALELAAARLRHLPLEALNAQLAERRLPLLTGGARDLPARQRTLRDTVAWSYALLPPDEQALFRRLGVSAGGCTPAAAAAVCGESAGAATLDGLASLVDHSLLQPDLGDDGAGESRFRMLETVREYALEQLEAAGEAPAARRRHAEYYLALAETAEPHLTGPDAESWLRQLEGESENLRAALGWAFEGGREGAAGAPGLRLAGALWRFWDWRGYTTEGRRWTEQALRACPGAPPRVAGRALCGVATLAWRRHDEDAARAGFEEGLALARRAGDEQTEAVALKGLGLMALYAGDHPRARARLRAALKAARAARDLRTAADALDGLGQLARFHSDYGAASRFHREALTLAGETGDRQAIGSALTNLSVVLRQQGAYEAARSRVEQALPLLRAVGTRSSLTAALRNRGQIAYLQGDLEAARTDFEQCRALCAAGEAGRARDVFGLSEALTRLANVARVRGEYAAARAAGEEALAVSWEGGRPQLEAYALQSLGLLASAEGDHAAARARHLASLRRFNALGDTYGAATALEGLAEAAAGAERWRDALWLAAAAAAARAAIGAPAAPLEREHLGRFLSRAREAVGGAAATVEARARQTPLASSVARALELEDVEESVGVAPAPDPASRADG
jgi:predicted ATPase/class 3 adenylate cyclase